MFTAQGEMRCDESNNNMGLVFTYNSFIVDRHCESRCESQEWIQSEFSVNVTSTKHAIHRNIIHVSKTHSQSRWYTLYINTN